MLHKYFFQEIIKNYWIESNSGGGGEEGEKEK